MIVRTWHGLAKADRAEAYIRHLEEQVFPALTRIEGHRGARVLRRETAEGVEFMVVTRWTSIDAIQAFAGDDLTRAVVEPEAQGHFLCMDDRVTHWDVALKTTGE